MPLDLTGPRQSFAARQLGDRCTILVPGLPTSDGGGGVANVPVESAPVPCKFGNVSGDEAGEALVAVRGRYRLKLAVDMAIDERCQVRFAGRVYQVVWAPPVTALSLARTVGLVEAR